MMSENSVKVLNYLKGIGDTNVTANDVADALDLTSKQVNGIFTAFQKKELGVRVPAEIENEDGTHKAVKLLKLTDAGIAFDPAAAE